ncbi:MAG: hypothetical protein IJP28_05025 [Erysipelotrichales bacterium]|nr:hypothetical protein [Erysipelotrichales bacterium]MBR3694492.1 hypothetical protein [Erysipelotrichales bacterium]
MDIVFLMWMLVGMGIAGVFGIIGYVVLAKYSEKLEDKDFANVFKMIRKKKK